MRVELAWGTGPHRAWFFLGESKCSVVVKSWQGQAQALLGLHL